MSVTFDIEAFSIDLTHDEAPDFIGDALTSLSAESLAEINVVNTSDISEWVKFKTDGFDVDNVRENDVQFLTNIGKWPIATRGYSREFMVTENPAITNNEIVQQLDAMPIKTLGCVPPNTKIDVIFLLDGSRSIDSNGGNNFQLSDSNGDLIANPSPGRLLTSGDYISGDYNDAQTPNFNAMKDFVQAVGDQLFNNDNLDVNIGIFQFSKRAWRTTNTSGPELHHTLSSTTTITSETALDTALSDIYLEHGFATETGNAIDAAREELVDNGRSGAIKLMVTLTDGASYPTSDTPTVQSAMDEVNETNIHSIAVGIGNVSSGSRRDNELNTIAQDKGSNRLTVTDFDGLDDIVMQLYTSIVSVSNQDLSNYFDRSVAYDRVRWMSRDLFSGVAGTHAEAVFGLDLFSNETQLREEIEAFDDKISGVISNAIADSNGKYWADGNCVAKDIITQAMRNDPGRFLTNQLLDPENRDSNGFYQFRFKVGDQIRFRVNYKIQDNETHKYPLGRTMPMIKDHSYIYQVNIISSDGCSN